MASTASRDFTAEFVVAEDKGCTDAPNAGSQKGLEGVEIDAHKLAQRQKQLDFGKNTLGYSMYTRLVPKGRRTKKDPSSPDPQQKISKRCFDGQVKTWRRSLHMYDEMAQQEGKKVTFGEKATPLGLLSSAQDSEGQGKKRIFHDSFPAKAPGGSVNPRHAQQQAKRSSAKPVPSSKPTAAETAPRPSAGKETVQDGEADLEDEIKIEIDDGNAGDVFNMCMGATASHSKVPKGAAWADDEDDEIEVQL